MLFKKLPSQLRKFQLKSTIGIKELNENYIQVKSTTSGERLYTGGVEFLQSNIAADENWFLCFFPLPFTQLVVFCSHVSSRRISCFHATSVQHFVPAETEKVLRHRSRSFMAARTSHDDSNSERSRTLLRSIRMELFFPR